VGTGDFNADGKPDIVWRNSTTGQNAVWYMDGVTYTGYAMLATVGAPWAIVGTADFNNDGKPDLLWRNTDTGQNALWYMDGAHSIQGVLIDAEADPNMEVRARATTLLPVPRASVATAKQVSSGATPQPVQTRSGT